MVFLEGFLRSLNEMRAGGGRYKGYLGKGSKEFVL